MDSYLPYLTSPRSTLPHRVWPPNLSWCGLPMGFFFFFQFTLPTMGPFYSPLAFPRSTLPPQRLASQLILVWVTYGGFSNSHYPPWGPSTHLWVYICLAFLLDLAFSPKSSPFLFGVVMLPSACFFSAIPSNLFLPSWKYGFASMIFLAAVVILR